MSIEDTKSKISVMQAAVDGKAIEYCVAGEGQWYPVGDGRGRPLWNWVKCEYRVAPPKPREIFLVYSQHGGVYSVRTDGELAEAESGNIGGTYAKFVEVL